MSPSTQECLRTEMMMTYLNFGDLNADMKKLTFGRVVGVITAGHFILASERRVRNIVWRIIRRPLLGGHCSHR